jgi:hypothetical protein
LNTNSNCLFSRILGTKSVGTPSSISSLSQGNFSGSLSHSELRSGSALSIGSADLSSKGLSNDSLGKTPQKSSIASALIESERNKEVNENGQSPSFASAKSLSPEIVVAEPIEPSKQVTEETAKIPQNRSEEKMPVETPKSVESRHKPEEKAKESIRPSEKSTAALEPTEKSKEPEKKREEADQVSSKPSSLPAKQPEVQEPVTNATSLAPTPDLKPQVPELDKSSAGCKCTIM